MSTHSVFIPPLHHAQAREALFDELPEVAMECAYALHATTDASASMIYTAILGAMTAAIGPVYVFKPPGRDPHPISSWTVVSANSGAGKTDLYKVLAKPFLDQAEKRRRWYATEVEEYEAARSARLLKIERINRVLRGKGNKPSEAIELRQHLQNMRDYKFQPPREHPLIVDDFDHESFMALASGRSEAIAIFPNEGDRVFRSRWFTDKAETLNDMHDGVSPPVYRREKKPPLEAIDTHLSFNLYMRPAGLRRFARTHKNGETQKHWLEELGVFARFRMSHESAGPRNIWLYRPADPQVCMGRLQTWLDSWLDLHFEMKRKGDNSRAVLELAPDALGYWDGMVRWVKGARNNELAHIDAFAGKMLFHTGSLAAAIHLGASTSSLVTRDALERAWSFVMVFAENYAQTFAPAPPPSVLEKDARRIEDYLRSRRGEFDYQDLDLIHMGYMLDIPKHRVLAVAHHLTHYGYATFNNHESASIDVSPMMVTTRWITRR